MIILATQLIGAPLYFINKPVYYAWMARTKKHFGVVVTTITQWWSPTIIRVTGDRTVRDQIKRSPDGSLECQFPERLVLIANHQLYSDWLYLWWIAYTARMHGFIYIVLKESLKYLPFIGVGMQFFGFIFMARKWEQDKSRLQHRLSKLTAGRDTPMWLLIFPEGTNLSINGRWTSSRYAQKLGFPDMRHQMLPRSTGLRFCLEQMKDTVDWVYDCTVAYEGIARGTFGQDYFTLYSTYFQGRPPKSVNMHWRRFAIDTIPIDDPTKFELWLRERWAEKDELLEHYVSNGSFPEDVDQDDDFLPTVSESNRNNHLRNRITSKTGKDEANKEERWSGPIETEVKFSQWSDVVDIFTVVGATLLLLNVAFKFFSLLSLWSSSVSASDNIGVDYSNL